MITKKQQKEKEVEEEKTRLKELLKSPRGEFLIGRALWVAIDTLLLEPHPPFSDIEDMKGLMDHFFPLYKTIAAIDKMMLLHETKIIPPEGE